MLCQVIERYLIAVFGQKRELLNVNIGFMLFNDTFNNISVISWRSVLLVDETGVPGENYRPATRH
jgi:hypothetical protein